MKKNKMLFVFLAQLASSAGQVGYSVYVTY